MKKILSIVISLVIVLSITNSVPVITNAANNTVVMPSLYSGRRVSTPKIKVTKSINGKTIKLSTGTKKAKIYYKKSKKGSYKRYTEPFKISKTTTLYVKAKRSHWKTSKTVKKKISVSKLSRPEIKATAKSSSSIRVSWNKVSNADGYYIYRATSKDGSYSRVKKIRDSSATSWTNTGLKSGKYYYYRVRAYAYGRATSNYSYKKSAKTYSDWGKLNNFEIDKYKILCYNSWEYDETAGSYPGFILSWDYIVDVYGYQISLHNERTDSWITSNVDTDANFVAVRYPKYCDKIRVRAYKYTSSGNIKYGPYKYYTFDYSEYSPHIDVCLDEWEELSDFCIKNDLYSLQFYY